MGETNIYHFDVLVVVSRARLAQQKEILSRARAPIQSGPSAEDSRYAIGNPDIDVLGNGSGPANLSLNTPLTLGL